MSDYKKTLRLPKTDFPMKAGLTQSEPKTLATWAEMDAYGQMIEASGQSGEGGQAKAERFTLHDGPPYANGHIHLGTAMNKILKDIIVKHKNLSGRRAEYVPGWDCHGLPIELKVEQQLKDEKKADLTTVEVRRRCREYAAGFVDIQREEFKRLGVFGAWDQPYLTMSPEYESATAGELAKFMARGGVVRGKKPIHWCISCETALAEAEVEYGNHTSWSVYVAFPLTDERIRELSPKADPANAFVAIWTTTPWTLPANMAVAAHPEFDYVLVQVTGADGGSRQFILAEALLEACFTLFGWTNVETLATFPGAKLEGLQARHPFYDRASPLVLADYVALDTGTGLVHTAPGHGREDFETGLKYGLEVLSPLDDKGRFLADAQPFTGKTVFKANPEVVELLKEKGRLLAQETITHSYPHCWRCKKPVIFRATTQWFISMEKNELRKKALSAIDRDVRWIPAWGRERIHNMVAQRPDWCISRQRAWGVPIIALICEDCDETFMDPAWAADVANRFASHERGCDYWFEADLAEIVPAGLKCSKCGGSHFKREDDILDVWFDSGTSYAAVVMQRPELTFPADLYLEGSDQHRGWFHSSLLASVGARDVPPYKAVLTHGYVVDGQGRKMSKSVGNVVAPQQVIDKHGAEILRLWASSVDYREDVRISDEIVSRLVDAYRRIRNTCRFILGNLADFAPEHAVAEADMTPLDRHGLQLAWQAHLVAQAAYEDYEFHKVSHGLHNLCVTDLSAFYLDILKDRLYVAPENSRERRSAQTVLWRTLRWMVLDMAPIMSFTAEEVFRYFPEALKDKAATVFAFRDELDPPSPIPEAEAARWALLKPLRAEVSRILEPIRKAGTIGHSLDAAVTLYLDEKLLPLAADFPGFDAREFFIVSEAAFKPLSEAAGELHEVEDPDLAGKVRVAAAPAKGEKCERCWTYSRELGGVAEHPAICPRCAAAVVAQAQAG